MTTAPLIVPQHEAARMLGVGLDRLRSLISDGELAIVEIGSDERVPVRELERWVAANTRASKKCRSGGGGSDQPAAGSPDGSSTSGTPTRRTGGSTGRSTAASPSETPKGWNGAAGTSLTKPAAARVHRLPSGKP